MKTIKSCLIMGLAIVVMVMVMGCGGKSKKAEVQVVPEALPTVAANVASARHAGAAGPMMPIMELKGTVPGEGYNAEIKESREGNVITLKVMAVPGEGAVKGEKVSYTHKHTLKDLGAGSWVVKVVDHRGVEISRQEFTY